MVHKITGRRAAAIAISVERSLLDGRLTASASLPSVRGLAATLGVSPATVAAAYRLLRARGLTNAHGRRGTHLNPASGAAATRLAPAQADEEMVDLSTGNPDPALLPPLDGALRSLHVTGGAYGEPPQLPSLMRFVISEFEADGIRVPSLTIVSGALDAIERILRDHLRPGDHVGLEDPVFPAVRDLMLASGYVPESIAVDDEGPVVDDVERALRGRCKALIISPRAQNPTGAALGETRAADLRRLLRKHPGPLLIENDSTGPVAGSPPVTLSDAAPAAWAIVRSTSKFLGPDLRTAFVAGDVLTVSRVERRHALTSRWVSHLLQQLVLRVWSDPAGGRTLARAAEIYRQRRAALITALQERGIRAGGSSGLHVWIPVEDEAQAVSGLALGGWAVAPGERFRQRAGPAIRVTTAALLPPDATRLAERLADVIRHGGRSFA